ncbi:MAG: hypothetical protein CM1200mP23_2140 [Nitrososphaerota archaeon]|nr:MAG: hypothetical protein CM1200mP23_2140 [Nitrososphaerota archaeon]
MTIEDAKNQRSDINVQGTIEEKGEARTVNTKYGETQVCDSYLVDESGRIKLTLWGEDIEKVNKEILFRFKEHTQQLSEMKFS